MGKTKECSLAPLLGYYQLKRPIAWQKQFSRRAPLEIEIGFGLGEFLLHSASANPLCNYVGIEQHWERIYKTLRKITAADKGNIRILRIDARIAFERLFSCRSVDKIYCLFPCPWPKKGHVKHRLFSRAFLQLLNNRLKKGGEIKLVTDFFPYVQWVMEESRGTGFRVTKDVVDPQYGTKFERKWYQEGQRKFWELKFRKEKHLKVPLVKDTPLKAYTVQHFSPEHFRFSGVTGEVSVIFKGLLFDPAQQKAMVHMIVAEGPLTQHFRVSIFKKGKIWRVCKSDGQNFLPTPGTARAVELVYEAARAAR